MPAVLALCEWLATSNRQSALDNYDLLHFNFGMTPFQPPQLFTFKGHHQLYAQVVLPFCLSLLNLRFKVHAVCSICTQYLPACCSMTLQEAVHIWLTLPC